MTQALWTGSTLAAVMHGRSHDILPTTISGISIDSRTLQPGDAFFAIKGDKLDGHAYVKAAFERGAAVAVVSDAAIVRSMGGHGPLIVVDDVLLGLRQVALAARARAKGKIIAVTGSVGKTTTKEALRLVLSRDGVVHASEASYNNHWGVPLTLARLPEWADFGVFEIGMNHANEIRDLVKLVKPHVAIVTTVDAVHLEHFDSVEDIARAKAEIFEGLEPDGIAIINRDNPYWEILTQVAENLGVQVLTFGTNPEADGCLINIALKAEASVVAAKILGQDIAYKIGAPGQHLAYNTLAVLLAAKSAGADLALSALALADFSAQKGRGARFDLKIQGGQFVLIDESYNANPASMRAALALLGQAPVGLRGRRIVVLGDMLELGREAESLHRGLAPHLMEAKVDQVYLCGSLMKALWHALPPEKRGGFADTAAELAETVVADVRAGDVVMVKGSFGSRTGVVVEALKKSFPSLELDDETKLTA